MREAFLIEYMTESGFHLEYRILSDPYPATCLRELTRVVEKAEGHDYGQAKVALIAKLREKGYDVSQFEKRGEQNVSSSSS
jgi:hypothetical protein